MDLPPQKRRFWEDGSPYEEERRMPFLTTPEWVAMQQMIPDRKLREIAMKLWEKSRANEVEWKREILPGPHSDLETGEYLSVDFPKSQIRVLYRAPQTGPDFVAMQLRSQNGVTFSELKAEEGETDWELLQGLYAEALRAATKWDEVLSDVERAIAKPGRIGVS
jgi:hypothetical protein